MRKSTIAALCLLLVSLQLGCAHHHSTGREVIATPDAPAAIGPDLIEALEQVKRGERPK